VSCHAKRRSFHLEKTFPFEGTTIAKEKITKYRYMISMLDLLRRHEGEYIHHYGEEKPLVGKHD